MLLTIPLLVNAQQWEGKITDEKFTPLPYVNVTALTGDSAYIAGTVTDSTGVFVLPLQVGENAMLRITSIGYKTMYIKYEDLNSSPIIMHTDNFVLGEIIVNSKIPKYHRVKGGYSTNSANSIFTKMNNADEILSMLPRVTRNNGDFTVFGKGTPVIYINGRKITDNSELRQIKTENIRKITVLTNPGSQYDSEISSVIVIKTKRLNGEGLSGSINGVYNQSLKAGYNTDANLNWRLKNIDIFGGLSHNNNYRYNKQSVEQTIEGNKNRIQENQTRQTHDAKNHTVRCSFGTSELRNVSF